jgi:sulfoxide reductase catalytic subunit YedY
MTEEQTAMAAERTYGQDIPPEEITPESLYLSRRKFLTGAAVIAGAFLLESCGVGGNDQGGDGAAAGGGPGPVKATADDLGDELTSWEDVTGYNNFYEFSLTKEKVADLSKGFKTEPWTVTVDGLVQKPGEYTVDELLASWPEEERVYRMRCVEGWSMVIPWLGFPLRMLLNEVLPTPEAQYVRFESLLDPVQMPEQGGGFGFDWPYVEGLRIDEAMHDLTLLSTGLYGKRLLPQNGAPLRLVVPWKYGFKSIKSIVHIELTNTMPVSFWMASAPNEYGFYANVNPDVSHPRWSQKTERRIGELGRRDTLLFNGYDEVAPLYEGMDLRENF